MTTGKISTVVAHGFGRRAFLRAGVGTAAAAAAGLWLPNSASGQAAPLPAEAFESAAGPALAGLASLAAEDPQNGGAAPFPIPWLDKNGSFNQAPGPGQEPSNIFHFKGRIARANGFSGMGTDHRGRPIPFGTITTDFSVMRGTYWAGREERHGAFAHT
jgi:hypothetical protein